LFEALDLSANYILIINYKQGVDFVIV